jgi:hypothetical protein
MSRLISVAILAGVFLIMSDASGAAAASQAGGLPAVSDRVSALEQIATTLQAAVTTLQTQVATLQTANANLQNSVTSLQTANANLQSSLNNVQNALNTETAARTAGDSSLESALDGERLLRALADNNLSNQIQSAKALIESVGTFYDGPVTPGGLVMGAPATIATVGPLPAGNYLVIGRAIVRNSIHDVDWLCTLRDPAGQEIAGAIGFTQNNIDARGSETTFTLAGIASLSAPGTVRVECQNLTQTGGSDVIGQALAVKVGQPG